MKEDASALNEKIENLRRQLSQFEQARDSLNAEARKWAEERNRFNVSFKESVNEITRSKEQRQTLNERIDSLRATLQMTREMFYEKKVQFQNLKKRLKDLAADGSYMTREELEDRISKIEWIIQTTTLPLEEENQLVDQVRSLESQLVIHKQTGKLWEEIQSLKDAMKAAHREIPEVIEQRRKLRERLVDSSKRASELKSEADKLHQKYLECRDEAQKAHLRYVEILNEMSTLQRELNKLEEEEKAKLELEIRTDLEKRAIEKLKERKKLTFDEFKVLAEKGKI